MAAIMKGTAARPIPTAAYPFTCKPSDQFRLILTPDVNVWPGYKVNASNPGQTYYNLIAEGASEVTIEIPYPYVTSGAMPVHVYCADDLDFDDDGCFLPPSPVAAYPLRVAMTDWLTGRALRCVAAEQRRRDLPKGAAPAVSACRSLGSVRR